MYDYDVLIIGGGPSGLSAGIKTAKKGLKTIIIEKNSEIVKPLGINDCIPIEKMHALETIPVPNTQLQNQTLPLQKHNSFIEREIKTQRFFFGSGGVVTAHSHALTINRPLFDKLIAKKAKDNEVEMLMEVQLLNIRSLDNKLKVETTKGNFNTNIVIWCDEPSFYQAQFMNLNPPSDHVQFISYEIQGVYTDALDFYFNFQPSTRINYGWVFPKKNNTNIGIVTEISSKLESILDNFINYLQIKNIKKEEIVRKAVGNIPKSGPIPKTYSDNFLITAEAAGLLNTLFYGGISISIHSGILAGKIAIEAHEVNDFSKFQMSKFQKMLESMPYSDPIIQEAHKIIYSKFTEEELTKFGSLIDGWDITNFGKLKKIDLFLKTLRRPKMFKKFSLAKIIAYGINRSIGWVF